MRLVQVIPALSSNFGGPSVGAVALNRALNTLSASATLYSTDAASNDSDRLGRAERDALVTAPGTSVRIFHGNRPYRLYASKNLRQVLKREIKNSDVVHIHGQYLLPCVYAYHYARKSNKPYGVQLHGALEEFHRKSGRVRKGLFNIAVGKRILGNAAYVMCASESERETALSFVRAEQTVVIPLGVEMSGPDIEGSSATEPWHSGRLLNTVFLGRLTEKKQPLLAVDAWAKATRPSSARLFIAGPDGDFTAKQVRERAADRGVDDSVFVLGPVTGKKKQDLLSSCGMMVLPSLSENFGLTVVEGMAVGCHVVTTDAVASGRYLVEAGVGSVLANPVAAETLASSIGEYYGDPVAISERAVAGVPYVQAHLSWQATADSLLKRIHIEVRASGEEMK